MSVMVSVVSARVPVTGMPGVAIAPFPISLVTLLRTVTPVALLAVVMSESGQGEMAACMMALAVMPVFGAGRRCHAQ